MAVLDPVKLIVENYSSKNSEFLEADNNPENSTFGVRMLPFSRELYIERDDFMENPPNKFFRLSVGKEVRLKHAYYITCTGFKKDKDGQLLEITCKYDSTTKGGWSNDGRKVKGTIHWVSAPHAIEAEVRLYDKLFNVESPELDNINLNSIKIIKNAKVEPSLKNIDLDKKYQFLRLGYFVLDKDTSKENLVFNQSVALRSNWKKPNIG